jgi:hypothetical protein
MANTLTDLGNDIFIAADRVGRELTGLIPASTMNSGADRAPVDSVVRAAFTRQGEAIDIVPSMSLPDLQDATVDNQTMQLTKSRAYPISWSGEEQQFLDTGAGYETVFGDQLQQAMRRLTNEMEADLAVEALSRASRAHGTPGTTPFATVNDYTDATYTLKIIKDNGGAGLENQLVLDTDAGASFRGHQSAVNLTGTTATLREGVLEKTSGMVIRESAQMLNFIAGTAAGATTDATGYAVGVTSITLASAGTGTIIAGDVISFTGDNELYVVVTGSADVSAGGTVVLQQPGLRTAIPASATAVTVSTAGVGIPYAKNLCFARSALELAVRAPYKPGGSDAATDSIMVTDSVSGISYEVSTYKGYYAETIMVAATWGVKAWKPENIALLLG